MFHAPTAIGIVQYDQCQSVPNSALLTAGIRRETPAASRQTLRPCISQGLKSNCVEWRERLSAVASVSSMKLAIRGTPVQVSIATSAIPTVP